MRLAGGYDTLDVAVKPLSNTAESMGLTEEATKDTIIAI